LLDCETRGGPSDDRGIYREVWWRGLRAADADPGPGAVEPIRHAGPGRATGPASDRREADEIDLLRAEAGEAPERGQSGKFLDGRRTWRTPEVGLAERWRAVDCDGHPTERERRLVLRAVGSRNQVRSAVGVIGAQHPDQVALVQRARRDADRVALE
jgi:hypothetical protein